MSDEMKTPLLRQVIGSGFYKADDQKRAIPIVPEFESEEYLKKKHSYPENIIVSSRYNIINFLPKSLLEQFRRLANVYFLVIGIIATIGEETNYYATAIDPIGILAPMLIVVFISVIKDGVEDYKRHRADNAINSKPTRRIAHDGSVEDIVWRDILVGDLLVVYGDEELPADCVVITSGGTQKHSCFVETAAIDGETNLKMKLPAISFSNGRTLELSEDKKQVIGPMDSIRSAIVAEAPNSSIHRFNGFLEVPADPSITDGQRTPKQFPLNDKNLLLRGSTLRATEWCICAVVYTGADTKLSLNSKRPPSKLSSVDRIVNRTLLVAIATMLAVCIISMIFEIVWMDQNVNADYLCLQKDDLSSEYNGGGCESSAPSSVLTIFTFATLYNNFVCISMYVSLEMVYLAQSFFVSNDLTVYDEERDCPAECHTSGMCADLGQVQYILSDKTGTLTKNQMIVQQFSVANKIFGKPISLSDERREESTQEQKASHISAQDIEFVSNSESSLLLHETLFYPHLDLIQRLSIVNRSSTTIPADKTMASTQAEAFERTLILQFMRVLVYCNTAMLMPDESGSTEIHNISELKDRLQAESPDEVALILSAAEHASVLLEKRSNTEIVASGLNSFYSEEIAAASTSEFERVELLGVNEFDSDRKMMSVVIRLPDGIHCGSKLLRKRNMLLCKGADSSILANCISSENMYMEHCKSHIDYFANTGLRTLVLGYRELDDDELEKWLVEYREALNSISDRTELLKACANKIEKDLVLIGAIGIEDELQDGVPESIKVMHDAGLNVWMITGDKAETAVAIGKKCALIQPGRHEIERVLNLSDEALRQRIIDLHIFITSEEFRRQSGIALCCQSPPFSSFSSAERLSAINGRGQAHRDVRGNKQGRPSEIALIVDGLSLEGLWAAEDLRLKFIEVVQSVPTVIACRVSPLQKAALVRMVKAAPGNPVTLGIGDGANDVGMIHESRVGVGISGREGRHAANAADFAIAQFKFIVPLLFEHGRFNYIRCSKLVLYSFFKNLVLVSMLFYFCTYSGFSGTIPLDSIVFSGYNFYLGLPILVIGAMDFDVPRKDVYKFPYVAYATGRLGEMLNLKNMAKWCIFAFIQGLLLFTVTIRFISGTTFVGANGAYFEFDIYGVGMNSTFSGSALGIYAEGFVLYTVAVFSMQYKVVSMAVTPNYLFWLVWILSFSGYFLFTFVYGLFPKVDWYLAMPESMGHPQFWLAIFLVPFTLVFSDTIFDFVFAQFDPSSRDELVEKLKIYRLQHPEESDSFSGGVGSKSFSAAGSPAATGEHDRSRLSSNPRTSGGVALRALSQTSSMSQATTGSNPAANTVVHAAASAAVHNPVTAGHNNVGLSQDEND